jgi:hypothetical protein
MHLPARRFNGFSMKFYESPEVRAGATTRAAVNSLKTDRAIHQSGRMARRSPDPIAIQAPADGQVTT